MKLETLFEQAVRRVEQMKSCSRKSFNPHQRKLAGKIFEALKHSDNELQAIGIASGVFICERIEEHAINKAVETLKADPAFSELDEDDLTDIVTYFTEQNAASLVFAPEVLSAFIDFAKKVGFPVTIGGAEKGGFKAPRYDTSTLLSALVGAHVLTVVEVPAVDAQDAKHSSDESAWFKENPKVKVDVYEYDQSFVRELSHVLRALKIKEESQRSILNKLEEKRVINMEPDTQIEDLEKQLDALMFHALTEVDKKEEPEEEPEEEDDGSESETDHDHESSFFKQINDEMVEDFVDGLLIALGKLEQTGEISKIDTPEQARDAVLGVIRRMYQKRGLIGKLSRKYSRFGSKRILRKGKTDITKALSRS